MSDVGSDTIETPGPVSNQPNYFRIFFAAVSPTGTLEYKDQTSENGGYLENPTSLAQVSFASNHLNASVTQEGYVSLLATQVSDGQPIYIRERRNEQTGERFAEPQELGLPSGVSQCLDTLLINGVTGRQNVFLTSASADNAIWWKHQNPNTVSEETITVTPPGTDTPIEVTVPVEHPPAQIWSDWQQLPGALQSLAATQNGDNRIVLVGVNASGSAYLTLQSSDRPSVVEGWEEWQDISGGLSGFEQLICGIDGASIVHVFARIGMSIYMKVQTQVGSSSFSDWVLFASFADVVQAMAVDVSSNCGLYLVALVGSGSIGTIYAKYQTDAGGPIWSVPQAIAQVASDSTLTLQANADTTLTLFALDNGDNSAAYLTQQSLAHWSAVWTSLGGPYASIATTEDITPNPS